jgi:CheY-like chemotaxis protein
LLVVDDNEDNRYTLTRRLKREGYTNLTTANDGRQALELLRAQKFDLMLLDIMMPEMNGYEVLEHLKADPELRHLPVIMISAVGEVESVVRCIELGAEDYLPKPFNPTLSRPDRRLLTRKRLAITKPFHAAHEEERRRADRFLRAILPDEAARAQGDRQGSPTPHHRRRHRSATWWASRPIARQPPELVVEALGRLVDRFEEIAQKRGREKLKTVGDAFIATAGLLRVVDSPVLACVQAGHDMVAAAGQLDPPWQVRVGIHQGPVVAGIMGSQRFQFDLWGDDAVNTAARIASVCQPGAVTVASDTWLQIRDECRGRSRGPITLKGKGDVELIEVVGQVSPPNGSPFRCRHRHIEPSPPSASRPETPAGRHPSPQDLARLGSMAYVALAAFPGAVP